MWTELYAETGCLPVWWCGCRSKMDQHCLKTPENFKTTCTGLNTPDNFKLTDSVTQSHLEDLTSTTSDSLQQAFHDLGSTPSLSHSPMPEKTPDWLHGPASTPEYLIQVCTSRFICFAILFRHDSSYTCNNMMVE